MHFGGDAEMGKEKTKQNAINKYFLFVFSTLMCICVFVVMTQFYDPSQNNLRALASVCMDIVCIIILFILLSSFSFSNYGSNKTTRQYVGLLSATVWALFLDFLNWVFDGSLAYGHLTFWFTLGSLCMGSILVLFFCWYLCSYLEENHNLKNMPIRAKICSAINLISFVMTFIFAISGTAFQFVDGHYEIGALYDITTIIPILTMFYMAGLVIRHVRTIGKHDVIAVTGYILFMLGGAFVESAYSVGTTYVAVAIANMFIFVMLQNEVIARERQRTQVWMEKSHKDELTGLSNRYAYEEDIKKLQEEGMDENLTFLLVDVNSLKTVNDTMGHTAGDELLAGAASCLSKCINTYGTVYRMGGDEFVALMQVTENKLAEVQKQIDELTSAWHGDLVESLSLSCGYVSVRENKTMTIQQMSILADQRMYESKKNYYKRTGIDRRKR